MFVAVALFPCRDGDHLVPEFEDAIRVHSLQNKVTHINLLKPTGYVMHHQFNISTTVCSAHTVFMCFVFISEQTATCATYIIN